MSTDTIRSVTDRTEPQRERLTIDELARRTGMTVRNIRAHQARGLIPGPELEGRTGYYGAEHLARLEMVKELQAQGFNLEGIKKLLDEAGGATEEALEITRLIREPFGDEQPRETTFDELLERWGELGDLAMLRRAAALGLVRSLGGSRLEERSPRLSEAGVELGKLGIPGERALDIVEELQRHADGAAQAYVKLFLDEIWLPFEAAGKPEEQWPHVRDALERLRPLASQALMAIFGIRMADRVEEAFGREVERIASEADARTPRAS
jgi:DNA-binding transcriptional MerR regulator